MADDFVFVQAVRGSSDDILNLWLSVCRRCLP